MVFNIKVRAILWTLMMLLYKYLQFYEFLHAQIGVHFLFDEFVMIYA